MKWITMLRVFSACLLRRSFGLTGVSLSSNAFAGPFLSGSWIDPYVPAFIRPATANWQDTGVPTMPADERLALGTHSFTTPSRSTLTYFIQGGGPHLLVNIAPGWGCSSLLYQNSLGSMADVFTWVHLEARGTRESTFPADASLMSSWHMAEDIEHLRVHLGLDALEGLMGHSNGGCIAAWYAIRYPTRLRKLVLVGTQAFGPEAAALAEPATKAIVDSRPEHDAAEAYRRYAPGAMDSDEAFAAALDAVLPLYFAQPEKYLKYFREEVFTAVPQSKCVRAQWKAEEQHLDQVEQLGQVTAQALIVVGREDFICPVPASELYAQRIPKATLSIVEDSGHLPWIEQQAVFRDVMEKFFGVV